MLVLGQLSKQNSPIAHYAEIARLSYYFILMKQRAMAWYAVIHYHKSLSLGTWMLSVWSAFRGWLSNTLWLKVLESNKLMVQSQMKRMHLCLLVETTYYTQKSKLRHWDFHNSQKYNKFQKNTKLIKYMVHI